MDGVGDLVLSLITVRGTESGLLDLLIFSLASVAAISLQDGARHSGRRAPLETQQGSRSARWQVESYLYLIGVIVIVPSEQAPPFVSCAFTCTRAPKWDPEMTTPFNTS